MNQVHLARVLSLRSPASLQRIHNELLIYSIGPQPSAFDGVRSKQSSNTQQRTLSAEADQPIAHNSGTNCLDIDNNDGKFLVSGGADACIRLWDLEATQKEDIHHSVASISRSSPGAHTHAITAAKFWTFDPEPSTLISASFDKSVKLTAITPTSLESVYTFPLDHAPYTIALSHIPSAHPLIAVGTQGTALRLLDLRSGLGTHSLPGHNGGVYSIAWSPKYDYLLASGAADGRVVLFDIRRATAAFGSLDLDDAVGVVGDDFHTGVGARIPLDWNARAHAGAVTSVSWTAAGDKIVTAGHDNRIRVFDAATGKNDLVHFGPRIRNGRIGPLNFLLSPSGCAQRGKEFLYWPNDDGKGDVYVHSLHEGHLVNVLSTPGVQRTNTQQAKRDNIAKLTSGGRINDLAWRINAASGRSMELYSGHGDGRIFCWAPTAHNEAESFENDGHIGNVPQLNEQEKAKKRKRDMVGDLVAGLSSKSMRV